MCASENCGNPYITKIIILDLEDNWIPKNEQKLRINMRSFLKKKLTSKKELKICKTTKDVR